MCPIRSLGNTLDSSLEVKFVPLSVNTSLGIPKWLKDSISASATDAASTRLKG